MLHASFRLGPPIYIRTTPIVSSDATPLIKRSFDPCTSTVTSHRDPVLEADRRDRPGARLRPQSGHT